MLVTSCIYISSSKDEDRTQFSVLKEKRIWTSKKFPLVREILHFFRPNKLCGYHTDAQTEKTISLSVQQACPSSPILLTILLLLPLLLLLLLLTIIIIIIIIMKFSRRQNSVTSSRADSRVKVWKISSVSGTGCVSFFRVAGKTKTDELVPYYSVYIAGHQFIRSGFTSHQ